MLTLGRRRVDLCADLTEAGLRRLYHRWVVGARGMTQLVGRETEDAGRKT
jgi:hypothetical protein